MISCALHESSRACRFGNTADWIVRIGRPAPSGAVDFGKPCRELIKALIHCQMMDADIGRDRLGGRGFRLSLTQETPFLEIIDEHLLDKR
jgi:hypothetical protein